MAEHSQSLCGDDGGDDGDDDSDEGETDYKFQEMYVPDDLCLAENMLLRNNTIISYRSCFCMDANPILLFSKNKILSSLLSYIHVPNTTTSTAVAPSPPHHHTTNITPTSTPTTTDCSDADDRCVSWAADGWCDRCPGYMEDTCPLSCGRCDDDDNDGGNEGKVNVTKNKTKQK